MAVYEVTTPDGKAYEVEGPAGASEAQLIAAVQRQITPSTPPRNRDAERKAINKRLAQLQPGGIGQGIAEFGKGILGGAAGILETGAIGAADFLTPDAFDDPVREGIKSAFDVIQEPLAPRANVGVGATAIPRKFGEALGSFGGILGASVVNPLAGAGLAVTAGMGEAVERAREAGATPAERARASILGGVVGATELLPVNRLIGSFSKNVGGELAEGYIKAGRRILEQAGFEGLQEFGANVGQNLIERGIYNPEQGTFEGSQDAFGYGAGVGGFVQAFAEMVAPRVRARGTPPPAEETDITDQIQALDQRQPLALPTPPIITPPPTDPKVITDQTPEARAQKALADKEKTEADESVIFGEAPRKQLPAPETEVIPEPTLLVDPKGITRRTGVPTETKRQTAAREGAERDIRETAAATFDTPSLEVIQGRQRLVANMRRKVVEDATIKNKEQLLSTFDQLYANPLGAKGVVPEDIFNEVLTAVKRQTKNATTKAKIDTLFKNVNVDDLYRKTGEAEYVGSLIEGGADARVDTTRSGVGVPSDRQDAPKTDAVQVGSAKKVDAPAAAGLGRPDAPVDRTDVGKRPEASALAKKPFSFDPAVAERLRKGEAFRKAEDERKALELEKQEVKDIVSKEQKEGFLADRKGLEAVDKKDLDNEFKQNFDRIATPEAKEMEFVPKTNIVVPSETGRGYDLDDVDLKDPTTAKDTRVILNLVTGKTKGLSKNKEAQETKKYFSKVASVHQGIENLIHDAIYATKRYRKEDLLKQDVPEIDPEILKSEKKKLAAGFAEAKLYDAYREGTSAIAARRAIQFLEDSKDISESTKKYIRDRLVEEGDKRADTNEVLDRKDVFRYLPTAEISTLSFSLHPEVKNSLYAGNLKNALKNIELTESLPKEITDLAKKLGDRIGTTKIKVNPKIKKGISGLFNPKTNTIEISPASGMNSHVLLHEVTHAVTSATLANKSHPLTKQLTALYDDVKPYLSTGYGTQSLDEFVAETFSNPEFQQELASISIKGQPVRALQRFFNSVVNFLRRIIGLDTVPLTALESASPLIEAIMAPAPEFRDAGALLMRTPDRMKDVVGNIERAVKDIRRSAPRTSKDVWSFIYDSKVASAAKNIFLGFTDVLTVGKLGEFSGMGDIGMRINDALNNQRGASEAARNRFIEAYDSIKKDRDALIKINENGIKILDDLVYSQDFGATIYQVDPTKKLTDYQETKKGVIQDKFDSSGNNLREIWQRQQNYLDQFKKSGERALVLSMFNKMRTHYRSEYNKLKVAIGKQIDDALGKDSDGAKQLKKNVFNKIFDANTLDVYFPLIREGDFAIKYMRTDADGDPEVFELVSTPQAQADRIAELEADSGVDKASIRKYNNSLELTSGFRNSPPTAFVGNILDVLNKKGTKENQELVDNLKTDITNLFVQTLPETSFARSLQKRKGTKGFEQNSMKAFEMKGLSLPSQVAKLEGTANLRALESELIKIRDGKIEKASKDFEAKKLFSKETITPEVNRITEELRKRIQFGMFGAQNKSLEKYVKGANQVAFAYTIGFNVSSAVVNLSQVPLFAYPYLSAQHGFKNSFKAVAEASKLTAGSRNAISKYFDADYKVKDEYKKIIRDKNETTADADAEIASLQEYGPLVKLAAERGQLTNTFLFDALGLQETQGLQKKGFAGFFDKIVGGSAFFFNQAERFNRQTVLMAAYKLALTNTDTTYGVNKEKTAGNPELAARYAIDQAQELNGGTVLETGPRYAQQHVGRIALMYKSYGLRMYTTMLQSTLRAIAGSNLTKEERIIAAKQLLYVHGSALAMAGVYGLPLYGAVKLVMDFFLDDEELDFDANTRQFFGEGLYKGPINALLGVDVASRIRLSGLLVQENRFNPNASIEEDLFFHLGGPAVSTLKRFDRALDDYAAGELGRMTENLFPAGLSNAWKSSVGRVRQEGYTTRRGDAIFTDNTLADNFGAFFGFAPVEYTRQMDINNDLKNIDINIGKNKSKLLKKYYYALRTNNYDELRDVTDEIMEWNKRYAQDKKVQINPKTIQRSMKSHEARSKNIQLYGGVNIINTGIIDQLRAEYD